MPNLTAPEAAAAASDILSAASGRDITVSAEAITRLIDVGLLPNSGRHRTPEATLSSLFQATHVIDGSGLEVLRVSVGPLSDGGDVDPYSDGTVRTLMGVDFHPSTVLSPRDRRAAWTGVWPVSEPVAAQAALDEIPMLASLKGFVHRSTARRVVGYRLDNTSGRRWIVTKKLTETQRTTLFPQHAVGAWMTVEPGSIAQVTTL